jgi:Family of unknown function (DUF5677)
MVESSAFVAARAFAEERILSLLNGLDHPIDGLPQPPVLSLGIARQAGDVYRSLLGACNRNELTAAMVLVRPIVEAAIVVRWIEVDPQPHTDMYFAEDDRQILGAAPILREQRRRRGLATAEPIIPKATEAEMKASVQRVRSEAIAAGRLPPKFNRLLPLVETMATETHDSAIWEGYQVIYRIVSPWTHFGGRSLAGHTTEARSDGTHLVPAHVYDASAIRSLTAPTMLVLLGSLSRLCDLGVDGETRLLQDTIALWPSEALKNVDIHGT